MDFIYGEGYDGGFFGRGRLKKNCIHVGDYFPSMESAEKRSNILLFKLAPQRIDYFDFKRSMTEQITVYRAQADIEYMFKNHPARCSFKAPVWKTKWIPLGDFPVRFSGDEFINAICLEVNTNRISVMVGARYVELEDIVRFGFYADTFAGTVAAIVDPGSTQHERDARVFKARGSKQDIEFKERAINFINSRKELSNGREN